MTVILPWHSSKVSLESCQTSNGCANQLTGFYMRAALAINGLSIIEKTIVSPFLSFQNLVTGISFFFTFKIHFFSQFISHFLQHWIFKYQVQQNLSSTFLFKKTHGSYSKHEIAIFLLKLMCYSYCKDALHFSPSISSAFLVLKTWDQIVVKVEVENKFIFNSNFCLYSKSFFCRS